MNARRITIPSAVAALREAAEAEGRSPRDLTPAEYRRFRVAQSASRPLPSHLAIAMVLGGWRRACEIAAAGVRPPARTG
jgi:hypothetical protein